MLARVTVTEGSESCRPLALRRPGRVLELPHNLTCPESETPVGTAVVQQRARLRAHDVQANRAIVLYRRVLLAMSVSD